MNMRSKKTVVIASVAVVASLASLASLFAIFSGNIFGQTTKTPFESISVMAFGPNNVLFVGDSKGSKIVAMELGDETPNAESASYNIFNIEDSVADYFNTKRSEIRVMDLKVHPQTKAAYLAVHKGFAQERTSHILTVDLDGSIAELNYSAYSSSSIDLVDLVNEDIVFWGRTPARTLTITDIDYYNGNIYVAGLSNEEFSSTLRKMPYPFNGGYVSSSVEMYHTTHNQMETRAPVRTQVIQELNGVDYLIAGYTCTPIVTVPLASLEDGKLVSGKTIAEIGYGNTPIDIMSFAASGPDEQGNFVSQQFILVTNSHRNASLFKVSDIEKMNQGGGLLTPAGSGSAGAEYQALPLSGLQHVDEQDSQFILGLKRNTETGDLDLVSFRKGGYLRLSEFINEFDFPTYEYAPEMEFMKQFQNQLIVDEGLTEYLH